MLKKKKKMAPPEISSGSMADIAFLLLIFFLVSTTIDADKGVFVSLPPKRENDDIQVEINERNIFKILINSRNLMLVEDNPMEMGQLNQALKDFVLNNRRNPDLSDSPQDAVVSLKTDRGTDYKVYLNVVDEIKRAYNEMRADVIGVDLETYLQMDKEKRAADKPKLDEARDKIPYQVSDAEPTAVGG